MAAGAVARHQVQEAAIHAFDAQLVVGNPRPVPTVIALDGIAEFMSVPPGSSGAWAYTPCGSACIPPGAVLAARPHVH